MDCTACRNFRWRWSYQFDDRIPACKKKGRSVWCDDAAKCENFQEKQPNQR